MRLRRSLPTLSHPFIQIARRKDSFSVFPIKSSIICDIAHISQFHRRTCFLDALRKVFNGASIPKNGVDPLVFKTVWKLSEYRENIAKAI